MRLQDLAFIESRIHQLETAMSDIDNCRVCQIKLQTSTQGKWEDGYCLDRLTPEFLAEIRKHIEIQRDEVRRDLNSKIKER